MKLSMTPLQELTVEGMELEMVWEQMEMRSAIVVELLDEMFGGGDGEEEEVDSNPEEDDDEDDEGDSDEMDFGLDGEEEEDEEEEDSDEGDEYEQEVGEESYRDLATGASLMEVDSEEEDEEDEEDEDERTGPAFDSTKNLSLDSFDEPSEGSSSRPQRRAPGPKSSVDSTFFSLHDFHVQADEGEYEMTKALRKAKGENTGEDGEEESDSDDEEGGIDLFASYGGMGGSDDEEEGEDGLDGNGELLFFDSIFVSITNTFD